MAHSRTLFRATRKMNKSKSTPESFVKKNSFRFRCQLSQRFLTRCFFHPSSSSARKVICTATVMMTNSLRRRKVLFIIRHLNTRGTTPPSSAPESCVRITGLPPLCLNQWRSPLHTAHCIPSHPIHARLTGCRGHCLAPRARKFPHQGMCGPPKTFFSGAGGVGGRHGVLALADTHQVPRQELHAATKCGLVQVVLPRRGGREHEALDLDG